MRNVYANSACNIAAAASIDPDGGLFRKRNVSEVGPAQIRRGKDMVIIHQEPYFETVVADADLQQRGWVFQERLLSPRTLHFTDSQIFFECFKHEVCEVFRYQAPTKYPRMKDLDVWFDIAKTVSDTTKPMPPTCFDHWCVWVEQYSQCALTRQEDRLMAFSGIADLVTEVTHDVYIAGLWRSRFAESLMWRPSMRIIQKQRQSAFPTWSRRSNIGVPSWSWASQDGGASYAHIRQPSPLLSLLPSQVFSSEAPLKTFPSIDQAPDGSPFILVDGYVFPGVIGDGEMWIEDQSGDLAHCTCEIVSAPIATDLGEIFPTGEDKRFAFLMCILQENRHLAGLILEPLEKSSSEVPEAKRIGIGYLYMLPDDPTETMAEETMAEETMDWFRGRVVEETNNWISGDMPEEETMDDLPETETETLPQVYRRMGFTFVKKEEDDDDDAGDGSCRTYYRIAETPEAMRRTIKLY